MAVSFQPQVWGDKIFSPITNAIQQERQRQHQKDLADAQNALAQQRIDETKRANMAREQNQATLLDMTKQDWQSKVDTGDYQRRELAKKNVYKKDILPFYQQQVDEIKKSRPWFLPEWDWLPGKTSQELINEITPPSYAPSIPLDKRVDPSVIMQATGQFLGPTGTYEGVDSYEILNELGIK